MADLEPELVRFSVGCAANVRFRPGEYLVREGERVGLKAPTNAFLTRAVRALEAKHSMLSLAYGAV